ncbi:MAG: insulinase family protein [Candidatus Electrothrix sp. GW3-4]|uniref:insulinase family protein n=1 Tax=Candidatus Electrothrix sp. GW3-4 TaxID=3126740 RepID=UPI0030D0872B
MTDFIPGSTYHGFILRRKEHVADINSEVYLFEHEVLGTPALAIKNADPNKTFCFTFQTVPEDSTGVAHILEHSVLMGSKKYPVHDVFGEINKGGLTTFLNAMTGSDTTWYPFASRNTTEYFNIMDVYCDVVLNPLLPRSTFEQEGWHYHKESEDAPLQFQGVVLNEMKGAFSDPIRSIFHHTFGGLMPNSTYAHESGGDPSVIPDLSYEQFVEFHRTHYHPSNGILFFYGDADLDQELAAVQDNFLASYDEPGSKAEIVRGDDISEPVFIEDGYAVQPGSDLSGKTYLAVGTAVGTVLDRQQNTAFQIIANILYNSDASPLKKAIVEAGLCRDFGGLFLADSCYKTFMMTYLAGSEADKRDSFLELYRRTLEEIVAQGLDQDLVLSELNKYEFAFREDLTKAQRGLDLIGKVLPALKHGSDPFEALAIEDLFASIRKKALEEKYFEELIRNELLENLAFVAVTLSPDQEKATQTAEQEQQRLAAYEQTLDQEKTATLIAKTQELMQLQQTPNSEETLALLPRLSRQDLDRKPDFLRAEVTDTDDVTCIINELDTNAIAYVQIGLDCSAISADLLPWLDLFGTIATEIGTASRDYMRFAKDINICTGGFSHSFATYQQMNAPETLQPILWFQIKALSGYLPQALELVSEVFADLDLTNRQRIREIVLREFTWTEHNVQSEGYSLAASRVFAHLSRSGMMNEYVHGVTSYLKLKELVAAYDEQEEVFLACLEALRTQVFQPENLKIAISGSRQDIEVIKEQAGTVRSSLQGRQQQIEEITFPDLPANQAFTTSADVVYNVQGCSLFTELEQYRGDFEVLKTWLSRDYLWNTVRQLGGAYGCFVQLHQLTGNVALVSYRDPQVSKTYAAYDAIADAVSKLELSREKLDQLIIGTYGTLNPLQSPAVQGLAARNEYLCAITPEYKQKRIGRVIDTEVEDMRSYAALLENLSSKGFRATIGSGEKIKAHAELFDDILGL